jgi:N,N'-diacetyllegionaminate synthase
MEKVIIIAEAGVNHDGDMNKAKELIRVAADSGADYVKFQTFKAELVVSKKAKKADYQVENTGQAESQYEMIKKLELSYGDFVELNNYAKSQKIKFLSTGFDEPSIEFLSGLNMDFIKIPSGEITNLPYLELVASKFKKVILSTGMATITEIKDSIKVLVEGGISRGDLTVLHCNTEYPTPMRDVNLIAMLHIKKELNVKVGYSDHTLGIEVPIAAVALGAVCIEKHFTLDKNMAGPDHVASLDPNELKSMVDSIRNIELALSGSGIKEVSASEDKNKAIVRKSIVAKTEIKKGELLTVQNIAIKRPGDGISPMKWYDVIGQKSAHNYEIDDLI